VSVTGRANALAPFQHRSFRFQWPADLLTSWAFEMETLILGWYILTETGSVVWLTVFASLQFLGTLLAPMLGVAGDRLGHGRVLSAMRGCYAVLAGCIAVLALAGWLNPVAVFCIAALSGLVRPSDMSMRTTLVGITMPAPLLMAALGVNRTTADSARVAGALVGAALAVLLGTGAAYLIITGLYGAAFLLTLGAAGSVRGGKATASPWRDLSDGFGYAWNTPCLLAALLMAFLVNLLAFPLSGGLLPYVAREVYGVDRTGLGYLVASFSSGALVSSLLLSARGSQVPAGRTMLIACAVWFGLLAVFSRTETALAGMVLLALAGFAQSLSQVPMAALLLRNTEARFRGRVMGLRSLAIYGLPLGLLAAGPLIERFGFTDTASGYACFGLACTLAIGFRWRAALWPTDTPAGLGRQ
jgi:hypothetical protein